MIYICRKCDAYCGVHKGTDIALGRIANRELRELKKQAHSFFDIIWKNGVMGRSEAYRWLSGVLEIPFKECHIGMFNEDQCRSAIMECKRLLNDNRRLDLDFGAEPITDFFDLP